MAETTTITPYSTAMKYVTLSSGGWMDTYDSQRCASYDLYDDIYNNDSSTYKLLLRDASDDSPLYIPTGKKIIKTLSRYVGRGWGVRVAAPVAVLGGEMPTDEQVALAQDAFGRLIARERLLTRFRSGVAEWLRRGDWLWYVSADPIKRAGARISVRTIDPRRYFPMFNDAQDLSRVTGQQLIEETLLGDTVVLRVQTWLKATDPSHSEYGDVEPEEGFDIEYSDELYSLENFSDVSKRKLLQSPVSQEALPGIKTLPIYHIRNNETSDDPFGRSDLSGLEGIVTGVNQAISDEDLALAMAGLGMYYTDSGAPVDETTGAVVDWKLGPGRVVEVAEGGTFGRLKGVESIDPTQVHVKYLESQAQATVGLTDVSTGTASASGESGVALSIRYSPIMDEVSVKNDIANTVLSQMFYDLKTWFAVYEGLDFGDVEVLSETDPVTSVIPFDRETRWTEVMDGVTAGLFTKAYALQILEEEFGYEFPAGYAATVAGETSADPFADRTAAELAAADAQE